MWPVLLSGCGCLLLAGEPETFTNPIAPSSADPWVIRRGGEYFYTKTTGGDIRVFRSTDLTTIDRPDNGRVVWRPEAGRPWSRNLWAPELHRLDDRWYIYFAADDGDNKNHRMYVLQAETDDPLGEYRWLGQLTDPTNRWAIDGTVVEWRDRRYFVWSGWEGTENVAQNLYIAELANPWTIAGERVLLARPTHPWERHGLPINEGPQALVHGGRLHLIYSGSGFWTPHYCFGRLTLTGDNPLDPSHWTKHPEPVFRGTEQVQGVGHGSFTTDGAGRWWLFYHAHTAPGVRPVRRDLRLQPFAFDADGTPDFGSPVAPGVALPRPAPPD